MTNATPRIGMPSLSSVCRRRRRTATASTAMSTTLSTAAMPLPNHLRRVACSCRLGGRQRREDLKTPAPSSSKPAWYSDDRLRMSYPGTEPRKTQCSSEPAGSRHERLASGLPAIEHRRVVLVGGAQELLVAAFLGHPGGGDVLRIDHADGRRRSKIPVAPSAYGAHRFGRQALAVGRGDEGPADLRHAFDRRPHVAPELGAAAFAEEGAGSLVVG